MKNTIYFLIISYFCLNLGDLLTTFIGLSLGAQEVNPLIKLGATVFFGVKIILPTIITISMLILNHYLNDKTLILITLVILNLMFIGVVINNIYVIYTQAGLGYGFNIINFKGVYNAI